MVKTSSLSLQIKAKAELELRSRGVSREDRETLSLSKYQIWQEKYRFDPAGFFTNCVDWGKSCPASYQLEIAGNLPEKRRVSVRAPHGVGKTALVALLILWFALVMDGWTDWKIPCTASAWRQLTKFLWPEVHKWARRLKWDIIGRDPFNERTELETLNLKLDTGEAFAMASDNSAMIEGAHAEWMMYVFDESKEIPAGTWDSAEGAFSTGNCFWLSVSTPGEPAGRFYDIQAHVPGYEDWWTRHITLAEAIAAGRINEEWANARRKQWGEKSAVYINRVLGDFATSEEDGVIPLRWIEMANARWQEIEDADIWDTFTFRCVGSDIARSGEDKCVDALRYDRPPTIVDGAEQVPGYKAIKELRKNTQSDTMETAGRIGAILRAYGGYANIDVIGIGAGVFDRLREQKYAVHAFNAAEKTDRTDDTGEWMFSNVRAAAWWNMRELLDPDNGHNVALPPDDLLTGDLVSVHWKVMSGAKIQVEAKEDIKERIGRSTDDGDAVVMAYYEDAQPDAEEWINTLQNRMGTNKR